MATIRKQLIPANDTLAHFKAWAQAIHDAFDTFGWVQAADSGQVDWGAIGAVPAGGSYVYEIWHAGDALNATHPFYLKVEYGTGGANCPAIAITLGQGSDGAGNLVNGQTRKVYPFGTNNTTTPYDCLFCGDTARIMFYMWRNWGEFMAHAERSKDNHGNDDGDYIYLHGAWPGPVYRAQGLVGNVIEDPSGWWGTEKTTWEGLQDTVNPSHMQGHIGVYPCQPTFGWVRNPHDGILRGQNNDWNELDEVTLEVFAGKPHNYIVLGCRAGGLSVNLGNGNWCGLFRWD